MNMPEEAQLRAWATAQNAGTAAAEATREIADVFARWLSHVNQNTPEAWREARADWDYLEGALWRQRGSLRSYATARTEYVKRYGPEAPNNETTERDEDDA